jgi:hypothetical protein
MSLKLIKLYSWQLPPPAEHIQAIAEKLHVTAEVVQMDTGPLEARAAAISDALQDPFIDRATACELIDELAEIEIKLEKE